MIQKKVLGYSMNYFVWSFYLKHSTTHLSLKRRGGGGQCSTSETQEYIESSNPFKNQKQIGINRKRKVKLTI